MFLELFSGISLKKRANFYENDLLESSFFLFRRLALCNLLIVILATISGIIFFQQLIFNNYENQNFFLIIVKACLCLFLVMLWTFFVFNFQRFISIIGSESTEDILQKKLFRFLFIVLITLVISLAITIPYQWAFFKNDITSASSRERINDLNKFYFSNEIKYEQNIRKLYLEIYDDKLIHSNLKQKKSASIFSQNQNNAFDSIGNKNLSSSSRNFEIIVTPQELISISSNEKIPDISLKIDSDQPSSITIDDLERIRSNGLITRPSFDNNCLSLTDAEDKSNQVVVKRKLLLDCIQSLKKEIEFIENQLHGKEVNLDQNIYFNLKIKILILEKKLDLIRYELYLLQDIGLIKKTVYAFQEAPGISWIMVAIIMLFQVLPVTLKSLLPRLTHEYFHEEFNRKLLVEQRNSFILPKAQIIQRLDGEPLYKDRFFGYELLRKQMITKYDYLKKKVHDDYVNSIKNINQKN
jgi:hypothetical protein